MKLYDSRTMRLIAIIAVFELVAWCEQNGYLPSCPGNGGFVVIKKGI